MRAAILALVLGLSGVARADLLKVGERAIEFDAAVDAAGKPWKLAAQRGRWLVLSIGAAWCGPCKDELPVWDRLAGETRGRVTFVAVAIDGDVEDGRAFHKRLGLRSMTRVYLPEDSSRMIDRYGASTLPATFLIGPDGVIRHVQLKFEKALAQREYEKLRDAIDRHVPRPRPPPVEKPPARPTPPARPIAPVVATIPALVWPAHSGTLWAQAWPRPTF